MLFHFPSFSMRLCSVSWFLLMPGVYSKCFLMFIFRTSTAVFYYTVSWQPLRVSPGSIIVIDKFVNNLNNLLQLHYNVI